MVLNLMRIPDNFGLIWGTYRNLERKWHQHDHPSSDERTFLDSMPFNLLGQVANFTRFLTQGVSLILKPS